jgi:transposase
MRPVVPKQRVREYRNVFGAVEPLTGGFIYSIEEKEKTEKGKPGRKKKGVRKKKLKLKQKGAKTRLMNVFMQKIADAYPNDRIVLVCDNAWWHKSKYLKVPERITILYIPPYTPEMNPIEQLWREIRTRMGNQYFHTITELLICLHNVLDSLSLETVQSITERDWFKALD